MKKLIILGDSILEGVTLSDKTERYRLCIPDYESLAKEGVEVKNFCKMGATIGYGERVLKEELKGGGEDCIVLFEYGGNDCDYRWSEISENPKGRHLCRTLPTEFEKVYGACVQYARSKGAKVLISNLPPLDSERYMNWISRGLNYDVILGWLGDKSMLYRWHETYNRLVERVAEKFNIALVDLRGAFLTSHNFKRLISGDGIHPTEDGHSLIRRKVTDAVLAEV